jgi:N-acetylmuramoyl-L-alanine amidase
MSSKIGLKLARNYSINFGLPKRPKKLLKFIVIHYTGMKNESSAIKRLHNPKSKVSSHYYIKYNGDILQLVPDLYVAWHAGKSVWKNYKSLNKYSIGIEISNPGHEHGYRGFNKKQIFSLKKLLKFLTKKFKIKREAILGHSDIAPLRKKDPGEYFPWHFLYKKNIGIWYKYKKNKEDKFKILKSKILEKNFFLNLKKFGYSILFENFSEKKKLIKVFQMRFRPERVSGILDLETFNISKTLK